MQFVHFTDLPGAKGIIQSRELWASSYVQAVFAVAVGGALVPGVQQTTKGRANNRKLAVVFEADAPDTAFPEEVTWKAEKIAIRNPKVMLASKASKLLDGSKVQGDDIIKLS